MYHPNVQQFAKAVDRGKTVKPKDKTEDIPPNENVDDQIIIIDINGDDICLQDGSDPSEQALQKSLTSGVALANTVPWGVRMQRSRGRGVGNGLPQLPQDPTMHFVFRYETTQDGSTNVKISDLAKSMVAATSSNSYRYLFRTIKVDRITIRAATGTIGGTAAVKLQFLGSNTNEITHMDQTMRVDHNACISLKPPRFSLASFWHDVTAATDDEVSLFEASTNTDGGGASYIDVSLSVVYDAARYITYTIQEGSLSGLNAGGLYYGKLGQGGAQLKWNPVGRVSLGI